MIIGAITEGLFVSQGTNEFGKDGKITYYNYFKVLIGEEVTMVKVPDDKITEFKACDFKQYQHIEFMVDIKLESDSDYSSRFIANLIYAGQIPLDINEKEDGKEKKR